MKTKILYALSSDPDDFYAEQLFVSVVSLKKNSPGVSVSVITDQATKNGLNERGPMGPKLIQIVDEWIVVTLDPSLPKEFRSRLLKTGMRQYIDGDFLYIDSDTIIAAPLDNIDHYPYELALCPDHHCTLQENPEKKWVRDKCMKLGEDLSGCEYYFNSGVILARDTTDVRNLFVNWQNYYIQGRNNGVKTDQQSLAKTINSSEFHIDQLEGKWNCQLPYGVRHMGEALIFHYFSGSYVNPDHPLYLLNDKDILNRIRNSELLPDEVSAVIDDFFKGFPKVSLLIDEYEMLFRTTRRYNDIFRNFVPGKFSFLESLLKLRARLPFKKK